MDKKIEVYYDGLCTLCSSSIRSVGTSSRGGAFDMIDVTRGALPPGVDEAGALRNMHVVDGEGRVYAGADAVLRIVREYPAWRWAALIGSLPGAVHLLRGAYRIIAAHRRRFNSTRR